MNNQNSSFNQYYQDVVDVLIGMDETQKPDRDTVREDYESGRESDESAHMFFDEWNLEDTD